MKNSFHCFKAFQVSTLRVTENLKWLSIPDPTGHNDKSDISLLFANAYIPNGGQGTVHHIYFFRTKC